MDVTPSGWLSTVGPAGLECDPLIMSQVLEIELRGVFAWATSLCSNSVSTDP